MTENFKILAKYIKDMSSETPDVETFISTGNHINKYQLDIDIKSLALKNKMIQIDIYPFYFLQTCRLKHLVFH